MPTVCRLAGKFVAAGETLDDLTGVAGIGLIKAIDRFDIGRDDDFVTFAIPLIVAEVMVHLRDSDWPSRAQRLLEQRAIAVQRARRELESMAGRSPTYADLADHLDLSLEQVLEATEASMAAQGGAR